MSEMSLSTYNVKKKIKTKIFDGSEADTQKLHDHDTATMSHVH